MHPLNLGELPVSRAFEIINLVLKKKASGEKVISLAVGEPMYDTPPGVIEEAYRSMKQGETHYTSPLGIQSVRKAAADKVRRKNGINCSPEDCAFLTSKAAIYAVFMSMAAGGRNEVLLPDPGFFYTEPALLAGLKVRYYGTLDGFYPDIGQLVSMVSDRTAGVVINSPCNPTGVVLGGGELRKIYDACVSDGAKLISDEAYEDIIYEKQHVSPGSFEQEPETVVSIFSLSKSYAMTGWRAGYVVASRDVMDGVSRLIEHTLTCLPPFIQRAAEYALANCDGQISRFREEFRTKRDFVQKRLNGLSGLRVNRIDGAFYAFPSYGNGMKSYEFSRRLIQEQNVAVLPGTAFGVGGEGHIRISFAGSIEDLDAGLDGLEMLLSSIRPPESRG